MSHYIVANLVNKKVHLGIYKLNKLLYIICVKTNERDDICKKFLES